MTFAAIAAELGIDERTVRRVVATVLRRMADETDASDTDEVLRALIGELRANYFSTEKATFSRVPRRFSRGVGSGPEHAPRVTPPSTVVPSNEGRRAGLSIPRRFPRSKP